MDKKFIGNCSIRFVPKKVICGPRKLKYVMEIIKILSKFALKLIK